MATVELPHPDDAPEEVRQLIRNTQKRYRVDFLPNMARALAGDRDLIAAYQGVPKWAFAPGRLSHAQKEMIATAVSAVNSCDYCTRFHQASGRRFGLDVDAEWYEGAFVVFQVNALLALADGFRVPPEDDEAHFPPPLLQPVGEDDETLLHAFVEMREWFELDGPPSVFRVLGNRPRQALSFWEWWKAVFADRNLERLFKEMIGYAVAISVKSDYGIAFFTRLLRRRGVDDAGLMEVMSVAHFFCGTAKFADMLQLESELTDEDIRNVTKQADSPA